MSKRFKNGVTSDADIVALNKDLRTRSGNTGGGDVFTRSLYLGPAGYVYTTDTSGTRVGFFGPDGQPATYWCMGGGTNPGGGGADAFNVHLTTGEILIGAAGQFSSSANVLSFLGGGGQDVGHRVYSTKSATVYEIWIDGAKVLSTSVATFNVTGSIVASVNVTATGNVFGKNIGQAAESNVGTVTTAATVDWTANGASQRLTLTSATNCTISMTAPSAVGWYTLKTISPPSGTVPAITWPASVKWAGGKKPVQATTLGRANVQRFYWDGTNYWGDAIVNAA